jgi:hypothetical protein
MDAIKTRSGVKGAAATRQHAEAITLEDLQKMMRWSEKECPSSLVDPEKVDTVQRIEELQFITKHGMMRAFSSSGFTLWTRYLAHLHHDSSHGSSDDYAGVMSSVNYRHAISRWAVLAPLLTISHTSRSISTVARVGKAEQGMIALVKVRLLIWVINNKLML